MVRQCVNILYNLYGYILQVDTEYPDELHNLHNNYSVAPEKTKKKKDIQSDYCKIITEKYNIKVEGVRKLVPNLGKKH